MAREKSVLTLSVVVPLLAAMASCAPANDSPDEVTNESEGPVTVKVGDARDVRPTGRGGGINGPSKSESIQPTALTQAAITYHGGPVMLGTVGIYYIWYGNWTDSAKSILTDMASGLGGSSWWNINTTYANGSGTRLSNSAAFRGSYQYTGTSGYATYLSDSDVRNIVANTITQGKLPTSADAVYVVLSSKDVNQGSGFCSDYCAWHTSASLGNARIKYAWVGDASQRCAGSCIGQSTTPNGNPGADGMASHIAHELTEAATDPVGNAWYDSGGDENADKCSWTFGTTSTASNGAKYNITLGGRKFLVQRNWVNANGGYCAMSYGGGTTTDQCPNDPNKTDPGLCGCGKREPTDTANYRDAQGYTCADWVGYDCTQAQEKYGYTAAQETSILTNCGKSCGICPN